MTTLGIAQIAICLGGLLLLVKPLGAFMAAVYEDRRTWLDPILRPSEHLIYRLCGVSPTEEMNWQTYAVAMLVFNFLGIGAVYLLQRGQGFLPLNPAELGAVAPDGAYNTAVSFATNTNWQNYGGETTLSYLTQLLALTTQNFVSAATGMAMFAAITRGLVRRNAQTLGNFWRDLTRSTLYILLPLSLVLAVTLVSQGVTQTFAPNVMARLVQATQTTSGELVTHQTIAVGPVASQVAIKQLGTNGGGFFNANSAHPFENPTPLSNLLETVAILLIPAALCYTFGKMVGDTRQGWAILAAMLIIFSVFLGIAVWAESAVNPIFAQLDIDQTLTDAHPGGNLEGKEVRFGIANTALWTVATTAASNGSVNSMLDSYMPLGGLVALVMMQLGEVVFGGVGSGLYGMFAFVIVAVFIAGQMVGRTPEYLGKKIQVYEMQMAALAILIMPLVVLGLTALAVVTDAGTASIFNPGAHGFSETLYAFSSLGNNNGSAFAGLNANTPFYNLAGALAMLIARYWLAIPMLAMAGSLARKKKTPESAGTLPTHTPLFIGWLVAIILIVGALNFLPALALGPIIEHLLLGVGV